MDYNEQIACIFDGMEGRTYEKSTYQCNYSDHLLYGH